MNLLRCGLGAVSQERIAEELLRRGIQVETPVEQTPSWWWEIPEEPTQPVIVVPGDEWPYVTEPLLPTIPVPDIGEEYIPPYAEDEYFPEWSPPEIPSVHPEAIMEAGQSPFMWLAIGLGLLMFLGYKAPKKKRKKKRKKKQAGKKTAMKGGYYAN